VRSHANVNGDYQGFFAIAAHYGSHATELTRDFSRFVDPRFGTDLFARAVEGFPNLRL
jgi:hypothetical protein